jgi:acylphosphatase
MLKELATLHAVISGHVQGVYFRAFVSEKAQALGLSGTVRNLPSGDAVEVIAEGERGKLLDLLRHLYSGPPGAEVEGIETTWSNFVGSFPNFQILYR